MAIRIKNLARAKKQIPILAMLCSQFLKIKKAYEVLGDKAKREEYDKRFASSKQREKTGTRKEKSFDFSHMEENFQEFFGFCPKGERKERQKTNPLDVQDLFERYMGIKK